MTMRRRFRELAGALVGAPGPSVRRRLRRLARLQASGHPQLAQFVSARLARRYGVYVNPKAVFSTTMRMPHPVGIVIGEGVRIGERVSIYQNVTLGGARLGDWQAGNYPEIGDDAVIFAGAVVVGAVKIGRHAVIAANAVVTKDVPDHATVAGVPAKVIRVSEPR
jgi:serine O-acetyltransferase